MKKKTTIFTISALLFLTSVMIWGKADCQENAMNPSVFSVLSVVQNQESGQAEKAKQKDEKEKTYKVTFIELGSVRCIPCKKMQKVMEAIEKEYGDQVKIVFHDVWTDEGKPYAKKFGIRLIPTQVFLDKEGKEYFRHEGFFPKDELVKVLKQQGVK